MLDKLIKGLSGLGGAAALTTGGVFLKNHVSRTILLKKYDGKIEKFEGEITGIYFPRSSDPDEFWEGLWIVEVAGEKLKENKGTKKDMEEGEREFGNTSRKIPGKEKEEINQNFPSEDLGKKYREMCFLWNSERSVDNVNPTDNSLCFTDHSWEIYKTKDGYRGYEKFKESNKEMGIGEYYGTLWMKFTKKCKTEIESKSDNSSQILQLFDDWKSNPETCSIT